MYTTRSSVYVRIYKLVFNRTSVLYTYTCTLLIVCNNTQVHEKRGYQTVQFFPLNGALISLQTLGHSVHTDMQTNTHVIHCNITNQTYVRTMPISYNMNNYT